MIRDELEALFRLDLQTKETDILDKVILDLDEGSFAPEVLNVYKKFVSMKQDAPDFMKENLFSTIRNFAIDCDKNSRFYEALTLYRFLMVKSGIFIQDYPFIAEILFKLHKLEEAVHFIKLYEEREDNKFLSYITLANFYNLKLKDFKTAIKYYEKYVEIDKTKPVIYTILASLYAKAYGDESLEKQILYFEKANSLKTDDRLILHGLAFAYEKIGNDIQADKFYKKLIENNPTVIDYYNYGSFLIHCGDFIKGSEYFAYRNLIDDDNFRNSLTPDLESLKVLKSDLSDKTVLVKYEQGFGDTFMYCRFIPLLKERVKKLVFVVQEPLFELIKKTFISEDIDIISDKTDLSDLKYDIGMMLLDLPYVLGINSEEIPYSDGYLDIEKSLVKTYEQKYLNGERKFRIGIAYAGDKNANYNSRNIDVGKFRILSGRSDVEIYSLQKEENETFDWLKPLGNTFKNFTDTACAIKNMDLVISTDNVILNLSGALGVKTFGLFNKQTNYRWFKLDSENTGWYESVKPFQTKIKDDWNEVFQQIINNVASLTKNRS